MVFGRYFLRASRCILKDFRRESLAVAMLTASVLVGSRFETFCELPIARVVGCIGVGIVEVLPPGWVFIGPVIDLLLGIRDNSAERNWFVTKKIVASAVGSMPPLVEMPQNCESGEGAQAERRQQPRDPLSHNAARQGVEGPRRTVQA